MKNITIVDIAKKASVSKTTVSRFLNGNYTSMSKATKQKLARIIEELNYVPNGIARGLKAKKTKIIGCVIADITNQFSSYIFKGIHDECKKHNYQLLIMDIGESAKGEIEAIQALLSYNVDGLIINTAGNNEEYLLKIKKEKKTPIVLADRNIEKKGKIDIVTSNNVQSSEELIDYLQKQGYENIAMFSYPLEANTIRQDRREGYIKSIKKHKLKVNEYIVTDEEIEKNIKKFLSKYPSKRAIFCVNGTMLLNLLQVLKKINVDFEKEKIGISSFDDWGWAELIGTEGITTIRQDSYECGRKCTQILFELIKNIDKKPEKIELKTKIIERGSTK